MGIYRKRPVVVEAVRLGTDVDASMPIWVFDAMMKGLLKVDQDGRTGEPEFFVKTLEGTMKAPVGHWLIRGVKGELYFCDPEIFEATYEQAPGALPRSYAGPALPCTVPD